MKTIKALLAFAVLLFGLAACGDDDGDNDTAAPNETTTTAEGGDAGECDDSDPVRAGLILSVSGPAAAIGEDAVLGSEIANEDINAAGGILGRCLEIILKDDGGDPTKASQVARELVDQEEVDFLVGPILSSPTGAALEITGPAEVLQVVVSAFAPAGDAATYPYVFRTEVATTRQAVDFAGYFKNQGFKKVGVIAVNNALGINASDELKKELEGTGIEVVAAEFHEAGAVDLSTQMNKLKAADPEAIAMFSTAAPDAVATIKARNALQWDVPILGFSSTGYEAVTDGVGADGMNNVFAGQLYHRLNRKPGEDTPSHEKAKAFWERMKEYLGQDPLTDSIQQPAGIYDSFWMMATAINEVGEIDKDAVKEYLETNGYDGVKASYTYTPESHEGILSDDLCWVVASSFKDGNHEIAQLSEG